MTEGQKRWSKGEKVCVSLAMLLLIGIIGLKAQELAGSSHEARQLAEWNRVCNALRSLPEGQHFPTSLAMLPVEKSQNRDEYLNVFEYTSNGVSCTLSMVTKQGRKSVTFPED